MTMSKSHASSPNLSTSSNPWEVAPEKSPVKPLTRQALKSGKEGDGCIASRQSMEQRIQGKKRWREGRASNRGQCLEVWNSNKHKKARKRRDHCFSSTAPLCHQPRALIQTVAFWHTFLRPKSWHIEMDSTMFDENSEKDYHPSSEDSIDRSNIDLGCCTPGCDSLDYSRTISDISTFSEPNDARSSSEEPHPMGRPVTKLIGHSPAVQTKLGMKQHSCVLFEKSNEEASHSELELMKERFSKLLLGEDMSGSGKGVCTAVTISNAITNLYATVFGQFWKLEPLSSEKKSMWRREMDCLLSVCDYIVEFYPSSQTLPDGSTLEVMATRLRSDIYINLPALEKLDSMLLEILDSFKNTEFWYVDEENMPSCATASKSFRRISHRNEEKWWLPIPCVPPLGLPKKSRKELQQKRDFANQIHKAAMAINNGILAEMEVPETYLAALPKSGRASVGDTIYRYMSTSDQFSTDYLLDCLDITSEHEALEIADRVEASLYVWQRKASMNYSKSSWDLVKDFMVDGDKNEMLANRAESLLLCLKQRYPGLSQTTLDTCRIQYNKDLGQAILESYSRVLESLAFKIITWIDDVLYIDGSVKKP